MNDAKQQLAYIEEMMATTKVNLSENSFYYLLWGWLVFVAALMNYYLLAVLDFDYHWIAWPILMALGGGISVFKSKKQAEKQQLTTKIDKILIYLWSGFGISMGVILLGMISAGPKGVYPMLMVLYGLGTFVSGSVINFKPLKIGAFGAWACAVVAFYQDDFTNHLLLIALAILVSYIIPGHLLASKK